MWSKWLPFYENLNFDIVSIGSLISNAAEIFNCFISYRCEATNEADNLSTEGDNLDFHPENFRPPAEVTLLVQYAPSVSVQPIRPGMVQEGDKVNFTSFYPQMSKKIGKISELFMI